MITEHRCVADALVRSSVGRRTKALVVGMRGLPREAGKTTHASAMLLLERKPNSPSSSPAVVGFSESGSVRAVGSPTPEQAIIDELSRPPGRITDLSVGRPCRASSSVAWDSSPISTQELRQAPPGRRAARVLRDIRGRTPARLGLLEMKYGYLVELASDGEWRTFGGAGGADSLSGRATQPGVNLGGGGWPGHFYAGGRFTALARISPGSSCASPMGSR